MASEYLLFGSGAFCDPHQNRKEEKEPKLNTKKSKKVLKGSLFRFNNIFSTKMASF